MAIFITAGLAFSCNNSNKKKQAAKSEGETAVSANTSKQKQNDTLAFTPDSLPAEPVFDIKTTMGDIVIKLYKDTPLHRANFIKLASHKFYDGILFHRVIKGFMIQTGDPLTKGPDANPARFGTGGPGYTIPAEILPVHKHKKGALAAARRGDTANPERASSGSQFYIVQDAGVCRQLDGAYTVFGETIKGFDVIDKIADVATGAHDIPQVPVKIISILPVKTAMVPGNK